MPSTNIELQITKAKALQKQLALISTEQKNQFLQTLAELLLLNKKQILQANQQDIELAKNKGLEPNLIDRLSLNENRIDDIAISVKDVALLQDEVFKIIDTKTNPANGLKITRMRVPIGLILMIYESRPNVTIDAAILCFKSGNGALLKCGSDSYFTSSILHSLFCQALKSSGLESFIDCFILLNPSQRELTGEVLQLDNLIDLVIPRGGKGLIKFVMQNSRIPVLKHLDGNCHLYIHAAANLQKALLVATNAKLRRTSVCGATETILIDAEIAHSFLPHLAKELNGKGCELVGCDRAMQISGLVKQASEDDFYQEFLAAKLAIKIVDNLNQAILHIAKYSSGHTESISTEDKKAANIFMRAVDSAIVMHNASTQFADGGELGLGAEIGISTNKLHARGPVALEGLTTYKFVVEGNYSIRS